MATLLRFKPLAATQTYQHRRFYLEGVSYMETTTQILIEQAELVMCFAGCTIAIAVENGQVYFAHIRPRSSNPSDPRLQAQTTRNDLAYNMAQIGGFDGIGLTDPHHYIVYGGNAVNEVNVRQGFASHCTHQYDKNSCPQWLWLLAGSTPPVLGKILQL